MHDPLLEKPHLDSSRNRTKDEAGDRPPKQQEVLAPGTAHIILLILNRDEKSLLQDRLHRFNLSY
jgi:hypothetical protein